MNSIYVIIVMEFLEKFLDYSWKFILEKGYKNPVNGFFFFFFERSSARMVQDSGQVISQERHLLSVLENSN